MARPHPAHQDDDVRPADHQYDNNHPNQNHQVAADDGRAEPERQAHHEARAPSVDRAHGKRAAQRADRTRDHVEPDTMTGDRGRSGHSRQSRTAAQHPHVRRWHVAA